MGAAAAAVVMRKERDLVERFRKAGATSAGTARSLSQLGIDDDGVAWHRLTRRAVVREGGPGTYYLDEASWTALGYIRRRVALVILTIAIVLLLGGLVLARK